MKSYGKLFWLIAGVALGVAATAYWMSTPKVLAYNDRFEDYIMCTGPCEVSPKTPTDGIWMLDYNRGKLLGTVIDRSRGKIHSWAEVDLVSEFGIQPRQNVHFVMTTGTIQSGLAALYVAETQTGKFGIYTMGPRSDGSGIVIRRHDLTWFRQPATK